VGFHLPGAFDKVLDIQHCYLQQDTSNEIRHAIKNICREHQWTFSNLRHKTGFLRNILVRNTLDGDIMVVLIVGEDDREKIELIVRTLRAQFSRIVSVYSCINNKVNDSFHDLEMKLESGDDGIVETLGHARFKIGPKSFFQTNSMQAATLYAIARKLANLKKTDVVYDLYCGVGSIGIYMADGCARVTGIEQISEAVDDARINARLNDIHNVEFVTGQVELLLDPDFITKHGKPDVVITDPPRAGMHPAVIQALLVSLPDRIVYVSCNPATQARDIKMLSGSYTLMTAAPVDMFPHTHHIECVALLQKNT
jgi:23S rRNA (uracil1939-C5)-methyltransferase